MSTRWDASAKTFVEDASSSNDLKIYLNTHPLFSRLTPAARSKAYTNTSIVRAIEGNVVLEKRGDKAQNLYILIEGDVEFTGDDDTFVNHITRTHAVFNTDATLMDGVVESTFVLKESGAVLRVPKSFFLSLEAAYPNLLKRLMHPDAITRDDDLEDFDVDLGGSLTSFPLPLFKDMRNKGALSTNIKGEIPDWRSYIGYFLTFLLPVFVYYFVKAFNVTTQEQLFYVALVATATMWFFNLVPKFIPAAFLLTAILAIGIVPVHVILEGFASDGFIILMSTYTIGAAILITGLGHRIVLRFFSKFGKAYNSSLKALFGAGVALTPMMPSFVARTDVMTPIYLEARETLGLQKDGVGSLHLALIIFYSVNLFSSVFISGSILNYLIISLFPTTMADQFSWLTWLEAASVYGIIMFFGFWGLQRTIFRGLDQPPINRTRLEGQLDIMGPLTTSEKAASFSVGIFILGVLTSSVSKLNVAWIALFCLCLLLFFRVVTQENFRRRVDWPFLIMLATTIGVGSAIKYLGIDQQFFNSFVSLTKDMGFLTSGNLSSKLTFLAICAFLALVLSKLLPMTPAIILGATVTVPLAAAHHVHPFVAGFVVLIVNEMWGSRHRVSHFTLFCNEVNVGDGLPFDDRGFISFQNKLTLLRIIGLGASIPYWIWLGLI